MSIVTPNLLHPVDVVVEQIDRGATVYDDDAREPIQAASRKVQVTLPGQPKWGASNRLEATAGGPVDNAQGYVLFRSIDLEAAGVALGNNDRLLFQGREVYIVRLQPMGHYNGQAKLVRAWFADREPAKSPAPTPVSPPAPGPIPPPDVGGLIVLLDNELGIASDAGDVTAWADQSGEGNNWLQTFPASRPSHNTGGPVPTVDFDETNEEFLFGPSSLSLFGTNPLSIFVVCSLDGAATDPIIGQGGAASPRLWIGDTEAVYSGPGGELVYPRDTDLAVRSLHHDGTDQYYWRNGVELARSSKTLGNQGSSPCVIGTDDGTNWGNLRVYSVIMYNAALTLAEVTGVDAHLQDRYL